MPVFGQILGIEGTAWNLSAALFDRDLISLVSRPYSPAHGGIHPREAAQHHASVMKELISSILKDPDKITGIAFSQGPGLGPCLRTVATAARSLALALDVPLVGVNHCVAHVEIGSFATGCRDPIVLYASGANTQVIGYLNGRYRIFGETLDIGIGNALDKFARSKDLPHPGGPVIETQAKLGKYIELPYTVKGMDLAFSGLVSAAKDSKATLPDVCYSLQETAFAMCVEVTERAMSLTGKNEVLLVGGVGANRRLQEMLRVMCEERGAKFYVPEQKYLGDNGAMIAYTGKLMLESGLSLLIESSQIKPSFRSDEVEVTWKNEVPRAGNEIVPGEMTRKRGAEAVVTFRNGTAEKHRIPKLYREHALDSRLIAERTRAEARLIAAARKGGVPTPVMSDITADTIVMEQVKGTLLTQNLTEEAVHKAGRMVGKLHTSGIMHGDLTTSNMILRENDGACVLIDFGLAQVNSEIEQRGVDIHVLFQTLESTAPEHADTLKAAFASGYAETFAEAADVFTREHEIGTEGEIPVKLTMVTSNSNKAKEVAEFFGGFLEVTHVPLEIPELRSDDVEVISRQKAQYAYDRLLTPLIVDDTSFSIDALNGFPGPYAAYVLQAIGNTGILKLMKDVDNQIAHFTTAIAFADERGIRHFSGTIHGRIITVPRGSGGFGYDPIFEVDGRTLAELPLEEKSRVSHRALALTAFRDWFIQEYRPLKSDTNG